MEETLRSNLIDLASSYRRASEATLPTIGRAALNDGSFFLRVERGDNFTIKTFDRVVSWFSDNWPEEANWPADIPRPTRPIAHASTPAEQREAV